jgi:hypothetical protein
MRERSVAVGLGHASDAKPPEPRPLVNHRRCRIATCTRAAVEMTLFEDEDDPKKPRPIVIPRKKRDPKDDEHDRHRHLT